MHVTIPTMARGLLVTLLAIATFAIAQPAAKASAGRLTNFPFVSRLRTSAGVFPLWAGRDS